MLSCGETSDGSHLIKTGKNTIESSWLSLKAPTLKLFLEIIPI
jgi:hypothetical protein